MHAAAVVNGHYSALDVKFYKPDHLYLGQW